MKQLNKQIMIILYLLFVGLCAIGGFWGTYKVSQLLTKDDELKKQHPIPDILLMDCDIEIEFNESTTKEITDWAYSKTHMEGGGLNKIEPLPVSGFFDEDLMLEYPHVEPNYSLNKVIYNDMRNLHVSGAAYSKDNATVITFYSNANRINISPPKKNSKESYFTIQSYNTTRKTFSGKLHSIQLMVDCQSKSQYLLDLNTIRYHYTAPIIKIVKMENMLLKTSKTKYFRLKNTHQAADGFYEAELIQTSI